MCLWSRFWAAYSPTTVQYPYSRPLLLFALSGNFCFYRKCCENVYRNKSSENFTRYNMFSLHGSVSLLFCTAWFCFSYSVLHGSASLLFCPAWFCFSLILSCMVLVLLNLSCMVLLLSYSVLPGSVSLLFWPAWFCFSLILSCMVLVFP